MAKNTQENEQHVPLPSEIEALIMDNEARLQELEHMLTNMDLPRKVTGALQGAKQNNQDALDLITALDIKRRIDAGEEQVIDGDVVRALAMGEHPVRVWRKHRGMTQKQLADAAGMAQSNISMLEVGTLQGTFDNMRAIARALDITLDDLIPWDDEGSPD